MSSICIRNFIYHIPWDLVQFPWNQLANGQIHNNLLDLYLFEMDYKIFENHNQK